MAPSRNKNSGVPFWPKRLPLLLTLNHSSSFIPTSSRRFLFLLLSHRNRLSRRASLSSPSSSAVRFSSFFPSEPPPSPSPFLTASLTGLLPTGFLCHLSTGDARNIAEDGRRLLSGCLHRRLPPSPPGPRLRLRCRLTVGPPSSLLQTDRWRLPFVFAGNRPPRAPSFALPPPATGAQPSTAATFPCRPSTAFPPWCRMDSNQLSAEATTLFQEGISLVMSRWSSLQLAIENEWGGRSTRAKAVKIASDVFTWFTQTKGELYIDDLEALLDEGMLSLNTEVADGSIEEVAYELVSMHEGCLGGNYESIQKLRASSSQARPVQHIRQMEDDDDDDEEEDDEEEDGDMMVDAPEMSTNQIPAKATKNERNSSNVADPDGWVVVSSKKNRGRRN